SASSPPASSATGRAAPSPSTGGSATPSLSRGGRLAALPHMELETLPPNGLDFSAAWAGPTVRDGGLNDAEHAGGATEVIAGRVAVTGPRVSGHFSVAVLGEGPLTLQDVAAGIETVAEAAQTVSTGLDLHARWCIGNLHRALPAAKGKTR